MPTKGVADVVFCIDASASMAPCFDAVRKHIASFVDGLTSNSNQEWDLRIDFVAHNACDSLEGGGIFTHRSLHESELFQILYQNTGKQGHFFTTDIHEFSRGLLEVSVQGDEAPLVALDFCLDLPWRNLAACHRVVIMLTDEPFEQSAMQDFQKEQLPQLISKIHDLHVMLFLVAPNSQMFDELASADGSEYEVIDQIGAGLANVNFSEVLKYIGKSVSASTLQAPMKPNVKRGLYRQSSWGLTDKKVTGE